MGILGAIVGAAAAAALAAADAKAVSDREAAEDNGKGKDWTEMRNGKPTPRR